MPPETIEITHEWLNRAARDLKAAERLLRGKSPLTDSAVFHCQQSVEKALKAFLAFHGIGFRKTHDIEELGTMVLKKSPKFGSLLTEAASLTPYATTFRYPGESEDPTLGEAKQALRLAKLLFKEISTALFPKQ